MKGAKGLWAVLVKRVAVVRNRISDGGEPLQRLLQSEAIRKEGANCEQQCQGKGWQVLRH